MQTLQDPEFGEMNVKKLSSSRSIKIRVGTDGRYIITAPSFTPMIMIKRVVNQSRSQLRELTLDRSAPDQYIHGQSIGKSHRLSIIETGMVTEPQSSITRQTIVVKIPVGTVVTEASVQQVIRDAIIRVLRREAKAHLPRRLHYIATQHGFSYDRVRFSHASGRWGSCSSSGTISLNIALMKLPDELIDYVIIHELAHTRHMNHSPAFWREVEAYDPHYRLHRRQIKRETPGV